MDDQGTRTDHTLLDIMQTEFRASLRLFYSRLQLAPPYDSVEKALRHLTASVQGLPADEQQRLLFDPTLRWARYRQVFIDSGLNQKHRGIIAGLAQRRTTLGLPPEFDAILDLYVRGD